MPRNGSGTYSLPAGNPVVSGTTIQASWANSTLADISTELTGSLARSGAGGMLGALRGVDGTVSVPAFSFTSETTSGFYRAGTGDVRFAMAGADVYTVTSTGVGIGTSSPTTKLDVSSSGTTTLRVNRSGVADVYITAGANGIYGLDTASTNLGFGVNNSLKMTLDASGNLLVGKTATTLSEKFAVKGTGSASVPTNLTDLSGALMLVESNKAGTGYGGVGYNDNGGGGAAVVFGRGASYDTNILFCTNPSGTTVSGAMTERARITSGGDLLVGDTATSAFFNGKLNVAGRVHAKADSGTTPLHFVWNESAIGNNGFIDFGTDATYTSRGGITYNRTGGLVAYNTTSDYRAKDIIGPVQNPGATIDALKVYEGVMKGATQSRPMLVAHEAQAVAPYAVTGEKDTVNEDGSPRFQQMDVSSLVPLLLAEIQSLRARVAALEA